MQWRVRGRMFRNALVQSIAVGPATAFLAVSLLVGPIFPVALIMCGLLGSVIAQAFELWVGIDLFCPHLGREPEQEG